MTTTDEITYSQIYTGLAHHRFELSSTEDGLVGMCLCGFVFVCGFEMDAVWDMISSHCEPIAADE